MTSRPVIAHILVQFPAIDCMTEPEYLLAASAVMRRMRYMLGPCDLVLHHTTRGRQLQATIACLIPVDAGSLSDPAIYEILERAAVDAALFDDGNPCQNVAHFVTGQHLIGQPITVSD
jgi:hypothetical protein